MISTVLHTVILIDTAVMITAICTQAGRADGISTALSAGNEKLKLFANSKSRGTDRVLEAVTAVTVFLFMALSIVIKLMA